MPYLSDSLIGSHVEEVPHSMRLSRSYKTEATTQKWRRGWKFLGDRVIGEEITYLGDFTQQLGRESQGQRSLKGSRD